MLVKAFAEIFGGFAKLLLDADKLIVFCNPVDSGGRAF